ncbi:hypothetical protein EMIT0194MI4_40228 [Pseudomonas sp. IT-194MI4]
MLILYNPKTTLRTSYAATEFFKSKIVQHACKNSPTLWDVPDLGSNRHPPQEIPHGVTK